MAALLDSLYANLHSGPSLNGGTRTLPVGQRSRPFVMELLPGSFTYVATVTMTCGYAAVKVLVSTVTNNNNFRVLAHQSEMLTPKARG